MKNSSFNLIHPDPRRYFYVLIFLMAQMYSSAQELEPRALTNVPPGYNFIATAYGYSQGNTLLDPAIPIDDLVGKINGAGLAYARSIKLFGQYAKVDALLPMASGSWTGKLQGEERERNITGLADLRLRLSVNLFGGTISKNDMNTPLIGGVSVQIIAPTGQYDNERLINLGSNRWAFRSQIGLARQFKRWIVELYTGVWLYTENKKFLGDGSIKLSPFGMIKTHLIRKLPNRNWIAFDIGYGVGARPTIDEVLKDARISSMRTGFTYALSIQNKHVLRASVFSSIRFEKGPDFDSIALSYVYRWVKVKEPATPSNK